MEECLSFSAGMLPDRAGQNRLTLKVDGGHDPALESGSGDSPVNAQVDRTYPSSSSNWTLDPDSALLCQRMGATAEVDAQPRRNIDLLLQDLMDGMKDHSLGRSLSEERSTTSTLADEPTLSTELATVSTIRGQR